RTSLRRVRTSGHRGAPLRQPPERSYHPSTRGPYRATEGSQESLPNTRQGTPSREHACSPPVARRTGKRNMRAICASVRIKSYIDKPIQEKTVTSCIYTLGTRDQDKPTFVMTNALATRQPRWVLSRYGSANDAFSSRHGVCRLHRRRN